MRRRFVPWWVVLVGSVELVLGVWALAPLTSCPS